MAAAHQRRLDIRLPDIDWAHIDRLHLGQPSGVDFDTFCTALLLDGLRVARTGGGISAMPPTKKPKATGRDA